MALFEKYDVKVVSYEIWSDLILTGNKHIPTRMVNKWARQNTVAVYAPSKTFNPAGLVGSCHIIYYKWLRDRVLKESSLPHYNDMNVLSMHALIGANKPEGHEWLDELCQVLTGNVDHACNYYGDAMAKGAEKIRQKNGGVSALWIPKRRNCSRRSCSGWNAGSSRSGGRLSVQRRLRGNRHWSKKSRRRSEQGLRADSAKGLPLCLPAGGRSSKKATGKKI